MTGSLLGIDEERVLNVTHSFPIPAESEAEGDIDVEDYQLKMLKLLKEVKSFLLFLFKKKFFFYISGFISKSDSL